MYRVTGASRASPATLDGAYEVATNPWPGESHDARVGLPHFFIEQVCAILWSHISTRSPVSIWFNKPEIKSTNGPFYGPIYDLGSAADLIIRDFVKQSFGPRSGTGLFRRRQLVMRVGDDFSKVPRRPSGRRLPMQQFELLDDQGDGIRSFVGISVALLALKRALFLIDEPEAFLHPPQAFRLGAAIAGTIKTVAANRRRDP